MLKSVHMIVNAARLGDRLPHGRGSVSTCKHGVAIMSRAPAVHPETTGRPAEHSKTTGGRAPWEHPVENSRRGGRARTPVEDDPKLSLAARSKTTGSRAPENADSQTPGGVATG